MLQHYNNHLTKITHCAHPITLVQTFPSAEAWLWCHRRKGERMLSSKGLPNPPSTHSSQSKAFLPELEEDLLFPCFWLPVPSSQIPMEQQNKATCAGQTFPEGANRRGLSYQRDMGANFTQDRMRQTRDLLSLRVSLSPSLKQCSWSGSCCV